MPVVWRTQPVIARHMVNVFKEGELPKEGFMQILHKTSRGRAGGSVVFEIFSRGI